MINIHTGSNKYAPQCPPAQECLWRIHFQKKVSGHLGYNLSVSGFRCNIWKTVTLESQKQQLEYWKNNNKRVVFSSGNATISFQWRLLEASSLSDPTSPEELCQAQRSRSPTGGTLLEGHVGPAEAASGQQHVPDQRLDGGFPHQPDEEELLDDRRRDSAERRQAKQELPEPVRLVGVLTPHIFLQSALGFLLQTLHVGHVRQSTGIYARRQGADRQCDETVTAERLTSRLSVLISINLQDSQSLFCHKHIGSSSDHQRL